MRARSGMALLLAWLALPACAAATIYRWVDARGITNYGDRPPAHVRVRVLDPGDSRVSVYSTDPLLREAIAAERERTVSDLRMARRQRDLEREWLARQYFAALRGVERESCCATTVWSPSPGVVFGAGAPLTVPQIQLPPGTIAGHVTGGGTIPGTSAFAPAPTATSRPVLERARGGVVLRVN
jgi:Domain of unknown function (DUF4124)